MKGPWRFGVVRGPWALAVLLLVGHTVYAAPRPFPRVELPESHLGPEQLAVIVNDADASSIEVGAYYAKERGLPPSQVVHVSFPSGLDSLDVDTFGRIRAEVEAQVAPQIQAFALAWTHPFRVGCMSISSAFALGFDPAYCATGCVPTKRSIYYNTASATPYATYHVRPTMMLAGSSVSQVRAMIDRGVRSDGRWPGGTAYLVQTGDRARNVRAASYASLQAQLARSYPIVLANEPLEGRSDVMFYFVGASQVPGLASLHFEDGAIADHLTSFGGVLTGGKQMSSLAWLDAGATASYGTVVEPCSFPAKFPDVGVVMGHYLSGETLIEAYWKSVSMPGQGVFIGEPLARPFSGARLTWTKDNTLSIETRELPPGNYLLQESDASHISFRTIGAWSFADFDVRDLRIPDALSNAVYRVVAAPPS